MIILLLFAFVSGLLTILAPCIWPLLPIILSASSLGDRSKPAGITIGVIGSFAFFTLTLSYIIKIIPFDPNILRLLSVFVLGFFGFSLIIPEWNKWVEGGISRLSSAFGPVKQSSGFMGGLITGISLGIVWSPCAGPILATIAALSATTSVNIGIIMVTIAYVLGIGIPLFLLTTLGNKIFSQSHALNKYTGQIQQIFGLIMIVTAVLIFTNQDKIIEAKLLNFFPSYSNFLINFEKNPKVIAALNLLKGNKNISSQKLENKPMPATAGANLPNLGRAPDFAGISNWLNTNKPLQLTDLKGKVILVDFWTYTCINCIRTLPHVTSWYEKYKDKGFIVVGIHTPEFEFEKITANVADSLKRFNINYPVAQDNNYNTWNAYNNQYWPADYLIDAKGNLRHTHFGEGDYDQTEEDIKELIVEAGKTVDETTINVPDLSPSGLISPETYLGSSRTERRASDIESIPTHYYALSGKWDIAPEYAKASAGSQLYFHFSAKHVYLVIHPNQPGDKVKIFLDGRPIAYYESGADVSSGIVILDRERLYNLVNLQNVENHILMLEFENDGIEGFAFTFG